MIIFQDANVTTGRSALWFSTMLTKEMEQYISPHCDLHFRNQTRNAFQGEGYRKKQYVTPPVAENTKCYVAVYHGKIWPLESV